MRRSANEPAASGGWRLVGPRGGSAERAGPRGGASDDGQGRAARGAAERGSYSEFQSDWAVDVCGLTAAGAAIAAPLQSAASLEDSASGSSPGSAARGTARGPRRPAARRPPPSRLAPGSRRRHGPGRGRADDGLPERRGRRRQRPRPADGRRHVRPQHPLDALRFAGLPGPRRRLDPAGAGRVVGGVAGRAGLHVPPAAERAASTTATRSRRRPCASPSTAPSIRRRARTTWRRRACC